MKSGIAEYNNIYEGKIKNVIDTNSDKRFLKGYYNYISGMSQATVYSYLIKVAQFLHHIEKTKAEDLDFDDYTGYMASIRNLTSSAQIVTYAALKKLSTYLFISGKSNKDYMLNIPKPKKKESQKTKEKRERGFLETNEIKDYLNNVNNGVGNDKARKRQERDKKRDMAIVMTFLNTGMRKSALFKLDLDSVDMVNRTITVTDKGDKVFVYEMNDALYKAMKEYLEVREDIYQPNKANKNALFLSVRHDRLSSPATANLIKKYAEGIDKNITPHKLRATYGTQLYNQTHDIMFVKSCMNHNSASTTELYIRGNTNENKKKAANIMETLM